MSLTSPGERNGLALAESPAEVGPPPLTRPAWAGVIGVLSIGLGADAVGDGFLTLLRYGGLMLTFGMGPGAFLPAGPWSLLSASYPMLKSLLGLVLLAAGLALYRGWRVGVLLHRVWAIAILPLSVLAGGAAMLSFAPSGFLGRSLLWLLDAAYPVFLLLWLRTPTRRSDIALRLDPSLAYGRPVWPAGIGTIAIVLPATWLLAYAVLIPYMVAHPWINETLLGRLPGVLRAAAAIALMAAWPLRFVLLIIGGVLLCKRRPGAVGFVLPAAGLSLLIQFAVVLATPLAFGWGLMVTGLVASLDDVAWAGFFLVWFLHPAIRRQVRAWPGRVSRAG